MSVCLSVCLFGTFGTSLSKVLNRIFINFSGLSQVSLNSLAAFHRIDGILIYYVLFSLKSEIRYIDPLHFARIYKMKSRC